MKQLLLCLVLCSIPLFSRAHDHIEVRRNPSNLSQLGIIDTGANLNQLATYFPLGESPSFNLPAFPGGAFATELSFSAFDNTPTPPGGATIRVAMLAVSGPAGGTFSFWETNATSPTWTRSSGWTAAGTDKPDLLVSQFSNGYGHIHGRAFTTSQAGVYDVTFQAIDTTARYSASAPFVVRFTAILPPRLSIRKAGSSIKLTFTSRLDLSYDVQSTTTLNVEDWETIGAPLNGTGGLLEFTDPIAARPRVFYRLVEYQ